MSIMMSNSAGLNAQVLFARVEFTRDRRIDATQYGRGDDQIDPALRSPYDENEASSESYRGLGGRLSDMAKVLGARDMQMPTLTSLPQRVSPRIIHPN
ncbi:unnamed protein product, partial [Iphiclides podalirius]